MPTLHLLNKRDHMNWATMPQPYIYIGRGRRNSSPLANSYRVGIDGDRDACYAQYRSWLWGALQDTTSAAYREIARIASMQGDVYLVCWCVPQACHGEIVIGAVEWYLKQHVNA